MEPRNHYETLGVSPDAPPEVVRAAHRALVKMHHPDGGAPDAERIRQINEAWAVLGRASSRAAYDRDLAATRDATGRRRPAPRDEAGFPHGTAGWGEDAGDATPPVEEVDDEEVVGDPGWGEGVGAPGWGEGVGDAGWGEGVGDATMPDASVADGTGPGREIERQGMRLPVGVVLFLLLLFGLTWFGVTRMDTPWALAAGVTGSTAGAVAWRRSFRWAYVLLLGASGCAVVAVLRAPELVGWRGWADAGGWLGRWLAALVWAIGSVLTTWWLISAARDERPPPDRYVG